MVANFWSDLFEAQKAEHLVAEHLATLTDEYTFEEVGNQREYFHKGDIKAVSKDGRVVMIEVKDDGRIWQTGNVLCEEEVFFKNDGCFRKGNMYSDYEIYCVVDRNSNTIYFIDFSILKKHYREGYYKIIPHAD